jgi:hypothetical protein
MSLMGNPDYTKATMLSYDVIKSWSDKDLILSYIIISGSFSFPDDTNYPSIPCNADETTIVYPLNGKCILTGAEYVAAKLQGCRFKIDEVFYIPFECNDKDEYINKPFASYVRERQRERRKHPKGTIENLIEKDMGNGIYGKEVEGINNKLKYDIKLKRTVRINGSDLSNPILAS